LLEAVVRIKKSTFTNILPQINYATWENVKFYSSEDWRLDGGQKQGFSHFLYLLLRATIEQTDKRIPLPPPATLNNKTTTIQQR